MILYFNKNGQLLEKLEYGSAPRVGMTNFQIFAYFNGLNPNDSSYLNYAVATLRLKRPDLEGSEYPDLFMSSASIDFDSSIESSNYFVNGTKYYGFVFDFSKVRDAEGVVKMLDTPGMWKGTITLINQENGDFVTGLVEFNVEGAVSDVDDDPTELTYETIIQNIAHNMLDYVKKTQVPNFQATCSYIRDILTNINGWVLSDYTSELISVVLDSTTYQGYKIKRNNQILEEEDAALYMQGMTGSSFVPTYNQERPSGSLLFAEDGTIYKPYYDNVNGLVLLILSSPYVTPAWVNNKNYATQTWVGNQGYATQTWVGNQGYATQTWVGNQGYAVDSGVVHNTGAETISGVKTFDSSIQAANGINLGNLNSIKPLVFNSSTSGGKYVNLYPTTNNSNNYTIYLPASNGTLATQEWVSAQGYLTSHQSLAGLVPYTGATNDVDLENYGLHAGGITLQKDNSQGASIRVKAGENNQGSAYGQLYVTDDYQPEALLKLADAMGTATTYSPTSIKVLGSQYKISFPEVQQNEVFALESETKLYRHIVTVVPYGYSDFIVLTIISRSGNYIGDMSELSDSISGFIIGAYVDEHSLNFVLLECSIYNGAITFGYIDENNTFADPTWNNPVVSNDIVEEI